MINDYTTIPIEITRGKKRKEYSGIKDVLQNSAEGFSTSVSPAG